MTPPRRRLELEGEIEWDGSLFIPVAPHEVERAALELVLLTEGSSSRLTMDSPTEVVRIERAKSSRVATADGVHTLGLSENFLEIVRGLLVDSYRDGPCPRNHVDLEIGDAVVTVMISDAERHPDGAPLRRLQRWYHNQTDGKWEHAYGVEIGTLDNPGWTLRVDLTGTPLNGRSFGKLERHRGEHDWLVCWLEQHQFHAACGPRNLDEALETFLEWASGG